MSDGGIDHLRRLTPARVALGRSGASLLTRVHLDFQLDHARARDAVHQRLDVAALGAAFRDADFHWIGVHSAAPDRLTYLKRPDLGRRLDAESRELLQRSSAAQPGADVVFVVADGLSARAAQCHAVPLLREIMPRLTAERWRPAPVVIAEQGRVALGDEIGSLLDARLVVILIGERPGLSSPDSLGAYLTWKPQPGRTDAERNCISNIRPGGLSYGTAAAKLHYLMGEARRRRLSGVTLKEETGALGP